MLLYFIFYHLRFLFALYFLRTFTIDLVSLFLCTESMSRSNLSSGTAPNSGEQTPTTADSLVGPSPVYWKSSSSDTSDSTTPLLWRHRPSDGDETTSSITAADIVIDENLDELFPRRDPEGQDHEDDLEEHVIKGDLEIRERWMNKDQFGEVDDDEVDNQDAKEADKEEEDNEDEEPTPKSKSLKRKVAKGEWHPKARGQLGQSPFGIICTAFIPPGLPRSPLRTWEHNVGCLLNSNSEFPN